MRDRRLWCSAEVPADRFGHHSCGRNATITRKGKRYCWQHDPEYVARNKEIRDAKYRQEQQKLHRQYELAARRRALADAAVAWWRDPATGTTKLTEAAASYCEVLDDPEWKGQR